MKDRTRPQAASRDRGRIQKSLVVMGDPVSVRTSGSRTEVRHCPSTRIPSPSHAAAAACPLDIWPASLSAPAAPCVARSSGTTGIAPDHARHVAPRPGHHWNAGLFVRQRGCPALAWLPWPLLVRPCPRATANMAYGAFAMRRPPTAAQSQRRHMGHPTVPFSQRRTLRSGYATVKAAT